MATPQLSPGVLIREVDLTVGRAENVLDNIGAIAGPFIKGPVNEPINISNERQLLEVFGNPSSKDNDYEYWMSASSYLSYGGVLKVVRVDDVALVNANAAVDEESTFVKILNFDDYNEKYSDDDDDQVFYFASKNPGSWGNDLKVCLIDDAADQRIKFNVESLTNFGIQVGYGLTTRLDNIQIPENGVLTNFTGYLKGIITNIENNSTGGIVDVKLISRVSSEGVETPITYSEDNNFTSFNRNSTFNFVDNAGEVLGLSEPQGGILDLTFSGGSEILSQSGAEYAGITGNGGSGENATFTITRDIDGIVTSVSIVSAGLGYIPEDVITIPGSLIGGGGSINAITPSGTSVGGVGTFIGVTGITDPAGGIDAAFTIERDEDGVILSVQILNSGYNYSIDDTITLSGSAVGGVDGIDDIIITVDEVVDNDVLTLVVVEVNEALTISTLSVTDWYNQQTLNLENSTIFWKSIAEKPKTNDYSLQRNSLNDALHIVIVDDSGSVTGIQGNILEKHLNLSKARDSISAVNSPQKIWYKEYLSLFSNYIFAGKTPSQSEDLFHNTRPVATGFSSQFIPLEGLWGLNTQGITFSSIGNKTYKLTGGSDYSISGVSLSALSNAYDLFSNKDEIDVDFLICGPSMPEELESQAKANKLISIANFRKDCIAVISPHRGGVVNIPNSGTQTTNSETQTNNIIRFFGPLASSSYTVFDSGYKYTYDRFNNKFRYIACNADIAGLMARTTLTSFPWFSPAGQQRGVLNNAIKLAYNPNKDQRDRLYSSRVNSIINQSGIGILLFGDKTALGFASAFDRINVRRLFITVQQALQSAADAQLFEFNDELTRSNFVNIVEPYLRDVQAKRGIFDFRVICDESNNTPDVIDNNEFRADIFLKPARSINYVTLTFVATRTGVSFEEVAGNV
jgi:hypothetical protein